MKAERTVLRGCRTLETEASGTDSDILLENGIISEIGSIDAADAHVVDARGLLALPGLTDCHVHLVLDGSPDIVGYAEAGVPELFHEKAVGHAALALRAGFTHLRDMGCFGFSVAGKQGAFGPGITAAGHMLMASGGHVKRIGRVLEGCADAADAIREQAEGGANFIKAIASGGLLTPGTSPLSSEMGREMLEAIARNARERGRYLAVHAYGPAEAENAVALGARSIEHGYWAKERTLRDAARKGTFFVPTLKALWSILDNSDQLPSYIVKNAEAAHAASERMVASAVKEGVLLGLGTDSGTPFNFHGENALELKLMHELGVPADKCLMAATEIAASLVGREGIGGKVMAGYAADIVLVSGDPLGDPGILCRMPAAVVKAGRVVSGLVSPH